MLFAAKSKQMALWSKEEHLREAERRAPACVPSVLARGFGKVDDEMDGLNLLTLFTDLFNRCSRLIDKSEFNHESTDSKIIPEDVKLFSFCSDT